jgi:hypothetical protein
MIGKVPILVAKEVQAQKQVCIFRELPYKRHFLQEMSEENFTNLDEISNYLKTMLHRTSMEALQGNVQGLLNILGNIRNIYTKISIGLTTMQEFMPRSLIRFYEKIANLQKQLAINKINYNYNDAVIAEIEIMEVYMETVREKIMKFWEKQPEFFLRMPSSLYCNLNPQLFLNEDFLPYTTGKMKLPSWVDPIAIEMINEARKIHQTNEQLTIQRERFTKYLTLVTRTKSGVSSEIIEMIVEYMPITVIFDLIASVSPSQFLEVDTEAETIYNHDSISIYVY